MRVIYCEFYIVDQIGQKECRGSDCEVCLFFEGHAQNDRIHSGLPALKHENIGKPLGLPLPLLHQGIIPVKAEIDLPSQIAQCNVIPWVTSATITHATPEIFRTDEPLIGHAECIHHHVTVHIPQLVADLHDRVCHANFPGDERVVTDLDHLCLLNSTLEDWPGVQGLIELIHLLCCLRIIHSKENELWLHEVFDRRTHGNEKWVVAEANMLIEQRTDLPVNGPRQYSRDNHHNLGLGDMFHQLGDPVLQIVVVKIHPRLWESGHSLI